MMHPQDWYALLVQCGVKPTVAAIWSTVFYEVVTPFKFSRGNDELDDFIGQILHESLNLTRLEEDLDYSATRLMMVWPKRFPTIDVALEYAHNPPKLAEKVYGGRMGNVNPGDGWTYRGRSPIMITGADGYRFVGDLMQQDLLGVPDLLAQPRYSLEACLLWWEAKIPDEFINDVRRVSMRVNGGIIGLSEREHLTAKAGQALDRLDEA